MEAFHVNVKAESSSASIRSGRGWSAQDAAPDSWQEGKEGGSGWHRDVLKPTYIAIKGHPTALEAPDRQLFKA